jgi:hypothetical protein
MFNKNLYNSSSGKRIVRDIVGAGNLETYQKKSVSRPVKSEVKQKKILKKEIKKEKRRFSYKKFLIALIIVFGGYMLISSSFGVLIKITPEQKIIPIDTTFIASKENGDLKLEIMKFQDEKTGEIPALDYKIENKKASGQIVVYNAFSSKPQVLVKRTRFESQDGKIYRISKSITVPGASKENGKLVPGSIEVTVYADKAGEEYNIDFSDFTIPGFKGSPRYEKFYARSKTPMAGGGTVKIPIVSKEDEKNLNLSLENTLRKQMLKKASIQKPDGWLFYDDAFEISFSSEKMPLTGNSDIPNKLIIKKIADFSGVLLNQKELVAAINGKYLEPGQKEKAEILNFNNLSFKIIKLDLKKEQMIFRMEGKAKFALLFDEEKLKQDLIKSDSGKTDVFKRYPEIKRAEIIYKPWWWRFFPKNPSKIDVEIKTDSY